jgi:hypothetical protein
VTFRALTVAIDTCTADAALEIARQVFPDRDPSSLRASDIVANFPAGEYGFRDVDGLKLPVLDTTVNVGNRALLAVYQNTQSLSLKGGELVDGYLVVTPDLFFSQPTPRAIRAAWPQLAFTEVIRSNGFDAFGAPISPFRVAQDLRIVKPLLSGPAVVFENIASGRKVDITANADRYVFCLLTEIAR